MNFKCKSIIYNNSLKNNYQLAEFPIILGLFCNSFEGIGKRKFLL